MANLPYKIKDYKANIIDLDKAKGIVVMYVNAFNKLDSDGDITVKGSFSKTIKENANRIKHLFNHDRTKLLGCPLEMLEDETGLKITSAINMNKQLGKDVFSDYVHFAEHNKTLEHSYGYEVIKRDEKDKRKITEQKLWEYSTLSFLGANENTPVVDLKGMETRLNEGGSDEYLKQIETKINTIKMLIKGNKPVELVQCKNCGLTFDYNGVKEFSIEDYIKQTMSYMIHYAAEDEVAEFVNKLKPELQAIVAQVLINPAAEMKEIKTDLTAKEIENLKQKSISVIQAGIMTYVNCPNCYETVYKSLPQAEPQGSTPPTKEPIKEWYQQINWKL